MIQPSQDKSKLLYDAVSQKYDVGSYDEFRTKLQDPAKREAFYKGVGAEYELGTYEEFSSKVSAPVKKKESSTSQSQKSESNGAVSFSGTSKRIEPRDERLGAVTSKDNVGSFRDRTETTDFAKLQKQDEDFKNNILRPELSKYREATKLSKEEEAEAAQELMDRKSGSGIGNFISEKAGQVANYLKTSLPLAGIPVGGSFIKDDPLKDQKISAKQELQKQGIAEPTPQQVADRADEIFVRDSRKEKKQQKINDYLNDLPEQTKTYLEVNADKRYKTLSANDKTLSDRIALQSKEGEELLSRFQDPNTTDEERAQLQVELQDVAKDLQVDYEKYTSTRDQLGTAEEELDAFRRNYGHVDNFNSRVLSSLSDFGVNLYSGANYIANTLGAGEEDRQLNIQDAKKGLEEYRNEFRPENKDLTLGNFFQYSTDLLAGQSGNLLSLYATGGASGVGLIGASATGQKYAEMFEANAKGANYSPTQMALAPLVSGASEAIFAELPTLKTLRSTGRIWRSALAEEAGKEVVDGAIQSTSKRIISELAKNTKREIATEEINNLVQNAVNKDILGDENVGYFDNSWKVLKDTALLTGMLQSPGAMAHVAMSGFKMFTQPFQNQKLDANGNKILEFAKELETKDLDEKSAAILQNQITNLTKESSAIIDEAATTIDGLSESEVVERAKLETRLTEIDSEATTIKESNLSDSAKEAALNDLSEEYKSTRQRADEIVAPKPLDESNLSPLKKELLRIGASRNLIDAISDNAELLKKDRASAELIAQAGFEPSGRHFNENGSERVEVFTSGKSQKDINRTIHHESVHAGTVLAIDNILKNPTEFKPNQIQAVNELSNIAKQYNSVLSESDKSSNIELTYGTQNIYEFVAEFVSNPKFRNYIGRVNPGEKFDAVKGQGGAIKYIWGKILEILGIEPKAITNERIDAVEKRINEIYSVNKGLNDQISKQKNASDLANNVRNREINEKTPTNATSTNENVRPQPGIVADENLAEVVQPTDDSGTSVESVPVSASKKLYTGRGKKITDFKKTKGEFVFLSENPKVAEYYGGDISNVTEAEVDTSDFLDLSSQEEKAKFISENYSKKDIEKLYPQILDRFIYEREKNDWIERKLKFLQEEERFSGDGQIQNSLLRKVKEKGYSGLILNDVFFGERDNSYILIDKSKAKPFNPEKVNKTYRTGDKGSDYTVKFSDGSLDIRDASGKEPSAPTRRKIEDAYSNDVDFTAGEIAPETDSSVDYNKHIAESSNNASEVAEALLNLDVQNYVENNISYKDQVIADNIGKVSRQSFVDFGDENFINNNMARAYLSKDGASIDTLAQEMSSIAQTEITPQDVVDFIVANPNGPQSLIAKAKRDATDPLKKRFSDLTGLPSTEKYLQKAVEQRNFKDNFATTVDFLTDEQLSTIQQEYEQSGQQQQEETAIARTADRIATPSAVTDATGSEVPGVRGEQEAEARVESEPVEDDANVASQGFAGSGENMRDLTGKGRVRDLSRAKRQFRKLWNNTFRSNSGLDSRVAEEVRSRNRDVAAFTDALDYEASLFKSLLNKVKKSDPNNFIANNLEINEYLAGATNKADFLSEEQKQQLDYFRSRIDTLSEGIISRLESKLESLEGNDNVFAKQSAERTQALIDTIKANKGKYLNRAYQIFVDDSYANIITQRKEEINSIGRARIDNAVNYLVNEEGYSKSDAEGYIADYLDSIRRAGNEVEFLANGKADAPFLKKRKDLPVEFRELLGESKDPIYNYVNTVYKLSNYIANLESQDRMRKTLLETGIAKTEPQQGYTKLTSDGEGWQTLSDLYVPVDVAEAMNDMAPLKRVDSGFYQAWIKFAAATKIGKTILSPTTTFRNLYSGVFLGANAGHFFLTSPKYTAEAFHQGFGTEKSQTQLKSERQKLIRLGILNDGGNAGELMAIVNDFSKQTERMVNRNVFQYSFDALKKFYAFGDDFYKTAGFYIEKSRFMDSGMPEAEAETKAAERIRNSYPTYSYIPKNLQRLRRLPVLGTFVSFPYEMIRTTKNNLGYIKEDFQSGRRKMAAQRTAGMIIANGLLYGLSAFTSSLIGFDDEDDDALRDMLPDWQKNSQLIYTGTKNGKPTFVDGTALFPSEVAMKPLSIIFEERAGRTTDDKIYTALKEALSPYIGLDISFKTVMELVNNRDQYDKEIYKGESVAEGFTNDPDAIMNHYLKQAGPGAYNNLTEFMRANEIGTEVFGDKFASYGKEYTNREALLGLLGFRISTINYNNGVSSYGFGVKNDYQNQRKELLDKMKVSKSLTKEEVSKIVSDYEKVNDEAIEKMGNIIAAGKKLGMTTDDIKGSLNRAGYSKKDAMILAAGGNPLLKEVSGQSESKHIQKIRVSYDKDQADKLVKTYRDNIKLLEDELNKVNRDNMKKNMELLRSRK